MDSCRRGSPAESAKRLIERCGCKPSVEGGEARRAFVSAAAALAESWNHGVFDVTLDPSTETYFGDVSSPGATFDVAWSGWGADWPSMGTVLPPLFDWI